MADREEKKVPGRRRVDAVLGVGGAMQALDENLDKLDAQGFVFKGLNIKAPDENRADWLVTIKADVEGAPVIAFTSAPGLPEAVYQAISQFSKRQLKWKDDSYAK